MTSNETDFKFDTNKTNTSEKRSEKLLAASNSTNNTSPHLLWLSTHAPGLIKSVDYSLQTAENIWKYNKAIEVILRTWNIPYLHSALLT